jgi:hypothetical protein
MRKQKGKFPGKKLLILMFLIFLGEKLYLGPLTEEIIASLTSEGLNLR